MLGRNVMANENHVLDNRETLVEALRCCAMGRCRGRNGKECPALTMDRCMEQIFQKAAELLEKDGEA